MTDSLALPVMVSVPALAPDASGLNTTVKSQVAPAALNEKAKGDRLVFVLPALKAGEAVTVVPTMLNYVKAPPHFAFQDEPGKPVAEDVEGRDGRDGQPQADKRRDERHGDAGRQFGRFGRDLGAGDDFEGIDHSLDRAE